MKILKKMRQKTFFKEQFFYISILFALLGNSIGMALNYFKPVRVNWSQILMLLSIVFLIDYSNLFFFRWKSFTKASLGLSFFLFFVLVYAVFTASDSGNYSLYVFHMLYAFLFSIFIHTQRNELDIENLLIVVFWGTFFFLPVVYKWTVSGELLTSWHAREGLEFFTAAKPIYINGIACLFFIKSGNKLAKIFFTIFLLLDFYLLLLLGKRTPLLCLIICVAIAYAKLDLLRFFLKPKRIVGLLCAITVILVFILNNKELVQVFNRLYERTLNGFYVMMGSTQYDDVSAAYRPLLRMKAAQIISEFSYFQYIFGAGVMTMYMDAPILQAYLDMGVAGIIGYTYYVVFLPMKIAFTNKSLAIVVLSMLCVYFAISGFSYDLPYKCYNYTPLVLLFYSLRAINIKQLLISR